MEERPFTKKEIAKAFAYAKKLIEKHPYPSSSDYKYDLVQEAILIEIEGRRKHSKEIQPVVRLFRTIKQTMYNNIRKKISESKTVNEFCEQKKVESKNFGPSTQEMAYSIRRNVEFLRENHPKLAEFYEKASRAVLEHENASSAAESLGISSSEFTKRTQKIRDLIKKGEVSYLANRR